MKIDKATGAPQFSEKDLANAGYLYTKNPHRFLVTVDDINLFLRVFMIRRNARKRKAKSRKP